MHESSLSISGPAGFIKFLSSHIIVSIYSVSVFTSISLMCICQIILMHNMFWLPTVLDSRCCSQSGHSNKHNWWYIVGREASVTCGKIKEQLSQPFSTGSSFKDNVNIFIKSSFMRAITKLKRWKIQPIKLNTIIQDIIKSNHMVSECVCGCACTCVCLPAYSWIFASVSFRYKAGNIVFLPLSQWARIHFISIYLFYLIFYYTHIGYPGWHL